MTNDKLSRSQIIVWFSLSLTFSVVYSLLALQQAFSSDYLVDSDARQHVFWMQQFLEPRLFADDLIADYHQSVAPVGYATLYQIMAGFGIHPLVFNKLVPTILGVITTGYCFGIGLELLPLPIAGFTASLLLNQNLWTTYTLISGTPRAFVYPIVLAFLYYLLRRSLFPCLGAIALLGVFYPQYVLICAGILILQMGNWQGGRWRLSGNRRDYWLGGLGLAVAILVLLPYTVQSNEFGPAIAASAARGLPEFMPEGRTPFFDANPWEFWLFGKRSSFLGGLSLPPLLYLGLLLPILWRYPSRFPLVKQVTRGMAILPEMVITAGMTFVLAHVFLFRLHLPIRYTTHSLRIVMALASAIAFVVVVDALVYWARVTSHRFRRGFAWVVTAVLGMILIFYPCFVSFPFTRYKQGQYPSLYEFLAQQPQPSLIASLDEEANNLPTFSQQPVLVSEMYAIPYHVGYYNQIRQRAIDLIQAQYSPDLSQVQQFIQRYGVTFFLVHRAAFTPDYIAGSNWLMQYPPATEAIAQLQAGINPALSQVTEQCSVFETDALMVLDAQCIMGIAE
ncbi:hypothetical protein [Coleofasciculus sp. E2-BRE-01]|uniref:hypothetical protein n=1 Tax=Coleofasciculus sp. E2-BRE-01 TaxID=3069524 RepID=UPI0032FB100B